MNIIPVYFCEYRATTDAHFPVKSTLVCMTHFCGTTDLEEDSSFLWALAMTSFSSLSVLLKKKLLLRKFHYGHAIKYWQEISAYICLAYKDVYCKKKKFANHFQTPWVKVSQCDFPVIP